MVLTMVIMHFISEPEAAQDLCRKFTVYWYMLVIALVMALLPVKYDYYILLINTTIRLGSSPFFIAVYNAIAVNLFSIDISSCIIEH